LQDIIQIALTSPCHNHNISLNKNMHLLVALWRRNSKK
jgi:hypothetical protein